MSQPIQQLIEPHVKDLGGFQVRRSLPHDECSLVGPFIFFDHLGPATFPPGKGIDVRPHPHINLATVTYLFEGAVMHRDSLGSVQEICPGAVNWMTAGRGIVHSERSPESVRHQTTTLHAIQTWIALPEADEEVEPWFHHYAAEVIPQWEETGALIKLIAGQAYGRTSPVKVYSPMLYLDVLLSEGGFFTLEADYSERAIYSVTDGLNVNGTGLEQHRLAVLKIGESVTITADGAARCVVIGGEPVGKRVKWWNFVSSRPERIEQAKRDWREQRFAKVPGEDEFIPLPQETEMVQPMS
ncbi:MAG: pirin family protein [Phormidesmis sp. RL_2_1]|nr:pirin family protein [Phormidesmis sp. RL_2_1]